MSKWTKEGNGMQAGREIKFRALGVDGDLHYFDIYDIVSPPDEDGVFYVRSNLGIPIAVEEGTEQQFTGLRDKNGKEIYEGDIALIYGDRCVIEYDSKSASYVARTKIDSYWALDEETFKLGVEVIGNIYENPELLEVNK